MKRRLLLLVAAALFSICTTAAAQSPIPRIVNGTPTVGYPSVGALLLFTDPQRNEFDGLCSGTLVGCSTFVTAAHCVCNDVAEDAASCARLGLIDPATMLVYFQHAGFFRVESAVIHPSYSFAEAADIAVLKLVQAPSGVAPSAINTLERLASGTVGTLVGFGSTGGRSRDGDNAGLKREGPVTTTGCEPEVPDQANICWRFNGEGSSTCSGDSGGPLFVDNLGAPVLAGTTSGGSRESCLAPDFSFDTDVFVYRSFVIDKAGEELGNVACDDLPVVGDAGVSVVQHTGTLTSSAPEARFEIEVPEGTKVLRIGMNGQITGGSGPSQVEDDFDLYLRGGAAPTRTVFDCADNGAGVFGFCQIVDPEPGAWHVLIDDAQGMGDWQATATLFADGAAPSCTGDCDRNSQVTVDELVAVIGMALGNGTTETCVSIDVDGNGTVTVDEIVAAVINALDGCS